MDSGIVAKATGIIARAAPQWTVGKVKCGKAKTPCEATASGKTRKRLSPVAAVRIPAVMIPTIIPRKSGS